MPKASRKEDSLSTGHDCVGSTILDTPSQGTVYINNKLAARVTDKTIAHPIAAPTCANHIANVNVGSSTVWIVGKNAARVDDSTDAGVMTSGSNNVYIGG